MIDPLDFEKRPLLARLTRWRKAASLILLFENSKLAFWRIVSWLALFAGLWSLQIPAVLGTYGPNVTFFIFLGGLLYLLRTDLPKFHWPTMQAAERRLEEDSALAHRPLSAIHDKLINPRLEPTRKLWKKNQDDAFITLKALRLAVPRPILPQRDPYALRMFAMLVLVIGLFAAGPQWPERIRYGLFPFSFSREAEQGSAVTLWITPPDYTAMPQMILQGSGKSDKVLNVPEGSILKIRLAEGFIQPVLTLGGKDAAEKDIPLEKLGDKSWGLETEIPPGTQLVLKQWPFTRARIPYHYIPDTPPKVTLTREPETLNKGETRFHMKLEDDYGVSDLTMHMELDPSITDRPMGGPYDETRAIMSTPGQAMDLEPVYDLSWHPWAGMPVVITFEGIDHKGQKGTVPPLHMTLPERSFTHPIAKKLIEFRKRLIWTPKDSAMNVAYDLQDLLQKPGAFGGDFTVFLSIRSASSRLAYNRDDVDSIARVVEQLWDTAVRIEDGNLPLAARDLRQAQRNLEKLLNDPNATDEQIADAMTELREAMANYFQEMFREMQKRMAQNGKNMQMPPEMMTKMINPNDIANFLDQLRAEALSGDRKNAREMLSQLQQFMDMLDPSMNAQMPPQMQFMMQGVSEMQQLIEKQQALRDQTQDQVDKLNPQQHYPEQTPLDDWAREMLKKWNAEKMPPQPQNEDLPAQPQQKVDTQPNKVEQDSLRYILGQLMMKADEQLGDIPQKMQDAEQQMRQSGEKLGDNNPTDSLPYQDQAIKDLKDAMGNMSQEMQQMMQQMMMLSFGSPMQFDPLGRPMNEDGPPGLFPGSRVKIPDEAQRKRVQDILKTLRKRSGEINRPDYELEYYRRLMKQF